jgi:hypothetical protein
MANSTDWARVIQTTIQNYLRETEQTRFRQCGDEQCWP